MSCFRCVMGGYRKCEQQRLPLNVNYLYIFELYIFCFCNYVFVTTCNDILSSECVCVFVNGGWSFKGLVVDPVSDCSMESVHRYVGYSWP